MENPHRFVDPGRAASVCEVAPALLARNCTFKLPATIDDAITINSGHAGRTLIGKILTVYPGDDSQVPDLAAGLDRIWQSAEGPEILTDLRLRPSSASWQLHSASSAVYTGR